MSNKTTFKRIALAVVAALGFGVLASVPSSAAVSSLTVTAVDGKATTTASDTSTAAIITVSGFVTSTNDTIVVSVIEDGARPTAQTGYTLGVARVGYLETTSSTASSVYAGETLTTNTGGTVTSIKTSLADSKLATTANAFKITSSAALRDIGAKFTVQFDSTNAITWGTYKYKAIVQAYSHDGATKTEVLGQASFSIVVAAPAAVTDAAIKTVDATKSIAIMGTAANYNATTVTPDSVLSVAATAATTNHAVILVRTFNAKDFAAAESVTATISVAGTLCSVVALTDAGTCGANLTLTGASGTETLTVRANGTAGVAKIDIKTTSKTFATKSLTFFATDPATYTPSLEIPVIKVGTTNGVVEIAALDANKNVWGGSKLYLFSSDTAIASDAECTFAAADQVHTCNLVGVKKGETKWTIGNKSTLATSTIKSAEFAGPRVTDEAAASVKIEFDKAAYAPGEKARIYVTPLDADGKGLPGGTSTALLATGGIASSVAFSSGSDTTTAVDLEVASASSATTGAKAGSAMYTVYMPFGKGTVTLTAKGGTGLPAAGRVALTASASVVDDSVDAAVDAAQEATDAAIAATDAAILAQEAADEAASAAIAAQETAQAAVDAVTALSAEVTKLVAQLATLQKLLNRVAKRVGVKL